MSSALRAKTVVLLGVAILILFLMSCASATQSTASASSTTKGSSAVTTQPSGSVPQYGGILRSALAGGISNFGDPTGVSEALSSVMMTPALEALFITDESGMPQPMLATSWKYADDKKSLTISLRQGVKFHDGTDFNADAVKFNLDRLKSITKTNLKTVSSIDVVDPYTVKLNLTEPDATLLSVLTSPTTTSRIISPTAVKEHATDKDWLLTHPTGTGPFKFVSYKTDELIKYTKWEGYWQKGKPYLDGVEVTLVADKTSALMLLKAGEIHFASVSTLDAKELEATGKFYLTSAVSNVIALVGDSGNADSPFSDLRVRQAVSYAVDTKMIADALGLGVYEPANQPAAPSCWFYSSVVKGYTYDTQKAKSLLADAGYPNGFKCSFLTRGALDNQDYPVAVQNYLNEVGILLNIDLPTTARYNEVIKAGWQNGLVADSVKVTVARDPTTEALAQFTAAGGQYVSILHPADVEDLVQQTKIELSFEKRKPLFAELYSLVIDKYCLMNTIYSSSGYNAVSVKVHDGEILTVPGRYLPDRIWLSK